jgi:hypothetical protein
MSMKTNEAASSGRFPPAILHRLFEIPSPPGYAWRLLGIPLTILVALLDYYTAEELNVTLLYLGPIALASWKLGKKEAIVVAAFSALIWFVEDRLRPGSMGSLLIPALNMVGLFGFFLTVVLILTSLRKAFTAQQRLIAELEEALGRVKTLSGLLPICSWCKRVRDDRGYWRAVEAYVEEHSDAEFTHGICPECMANVTSSGRRRTDRGV